MIADDLRAEREALGLTQADLADWIGLARSSVTNFETGRQDMPLSKVTAYADAVGCDLKVVRR
jgi:predicted transcriptional regulator